MSKSHNIDAKLAGYRKQQRGFNGGQDHGGGIVFDRYGEDGEEKFYVSIKVSYKPHA